MWVKATQIKFEEYGQTITNERQLSDGEYIKHFELTGANNKEIENFFIAIRTKTSFSILSDEGMNALIKLEPAGI